MIKMVKLVETGQNGEMGWNHPNWKVRRGNWKVA